MNWPTIGTIVVAALAGLFALVQLWVGWRLQHASKQLEKRDETEKAAAMAAAQLEQRRLDEGLAVRNDWKREVDELRARADRQDELLRQINEERAAEKLAFIDQIAALKTTIVEQAGELKLVRGMLEQTQAERNDLKQENRDLRTRVRELEPLQQKVTDLTAEVERLKAQLQMRRASDGAAV